MLTNFEIINGELSPEFNALNTYYSVNIENSEIEIEIYYECECCSVEILNNESLSVGENSVVVNVYSENETYSYNLLVTRENSESVFSEVDINAVELEETSTLMDVYETQYLIAFCALLILIMFKLLFLRKKKHKN